MKHLSLRSLLAGLVLAAPLFALGMDFSYMPPGQLVPGSGTGRVDMQVYVPGMRFPIENSPAYANSQVWGHGGSQGPGGGQCDVENFSYPWWDNYCESRQWDMPLCPSGTGHQGQDIRAATCESSVHWAVAAEDGTITNIGSYSVYLMSDGGTQHRYLHMDPASLQVSVSDRVTRGQRLGRVSNAFGGTPTTVHLHYDLNQNINGLGQVYVPTYMSLVTSYEALLGTPGQTCEAIGPEGGVIDNQSRCFQLFGPSASWRYVDTLGWDGDLWWTYAWEGDRSNWARWTLEIEQAGLFEVQVYSLPDYAQSQQALWRVRAGGVDHPLTVNHAGQSGWVSLGEFNFAAGGDQSVEMYDDTGELVSQERQLMADAVRLVPAGVTPDPDPMDAVEAADVMDDDVGATDAAEVDDAGMEVSVGDDVQLGDTPRGDAPGDTGSSDVDMAETPEVATACGCSVRASSTVPLWSAWALLALVVTARRARRRSTLHRSRT